MRLEVDSVLSQPIQEQNEEVEVVHEAEPVVSL